MRRTIPREAETLRVMPDLLTDRVSERTSLADWRL
jgi:hypothetical protein